MTLKVGLRKVAVYTLPRHSEGLARQLNELDALQSASLTSEQLGPPQECDAATTMHNRALNEQLSRTKVSSEVTF